ncbi:hypothetical protein FHR47_002315 [Xanthomonas arboricola]|uniref:hypothetical protein n=1 Tax=Xanthomonas cannabis TaxID=1885674 RepID=UPI00161F5799|nr:hypothetical protein [Xanthomonas cannabis]MBB3802067.1 hypothetical protein [Xanthomonas cannabis]
MPIQLKIATAVVLLALSFWAGWTWRGDRAGAAEDRQQASASAAEAQQVNDTRATEHAQADALADIGAKHEQDREAAPAVAAAVVAGLRDGNLKLRDGWASCETQRLSEATAGTRERDEAAQRREEFAGRIVRIGRDADDQLRACQAVIAADRQQAD